MSLDNYYKHRQCIKPGDLISFAGHPSIISKLISWRTGSIHTHSAMVIDLIEATGTRLLIIESLEGGPVPRYLSDRVEQYKGDVYHYPLKNNVTDEQRQIAVKWTWDMVCRGVKYDYHSLFRQAISKVSTDAKRLFCSEMVQMAWEHAGIIGKSKKAYTPGQLILLYVLGIGWKLN